MRHYHKAGQLECQLADVRKVQEEIDAAPPSSRRLMESFPRNEIPPDYRFLQEMKEDRARQQLEDAPGTDAGARASGKPVHARSGRTLPNCPERRTALQAAKGGAPETVQVRSDDCHNHRATWHP